MKLNVAALFFLGYSASADNLRANSPPRRYLQGPPSSSSTSSGTDWEITFIMDCCDVDEEDLQEVAQKAIDDINSSSSSSSSDSSTEDGQRVRLLKKDREFMQFSCNTKDIEKDLESLDSGSRRGRVRRLSANSDESTITMRGFDVCEMRARCGPVSDEDAEALARSLPGSGSGSGSGDRTRRLTGDDAKVTLVEPAC
ncbi:hypothetical protein ACHAXT_002036 [Thalassiosira profunda]